MEIASGVEISTSYYELKIETHFPFQVYVYGENFIEKKRFSISL